MTTFEEEVNIFLSTTFRDSVLENTGLDFTDALLPIAGALAHRCSKGTRRDVLEYLEASKIRLPLGMRFKLIAGITSLYAARLHNQSMDILDTSTTLQEVPAPLLGIEKNWLQGLLTPQDYFVAIDQAELSQQINEQEATFMRCRLRSAGGHSEECLKSDFEETQRLQVTCTAFAASSIRSTNISIDGLELEMAFAQGHTMTVSSSWPQSHTSQASIEPAAEQCPWASNCFPTTTGNLIRWRYIPQERSKKTHALFFSFPPSVGKASNDHQGINSSKRIKPVLQIGDTLHLYTNITKSILPFDVNTSFNVSGGRDMESVRDDNDGSADRDDYIIDSILRVTLEIYHVIGVDTYSILSPSISDDILSIAILVEGKISHNNLDSSTQGFSDGASELGMDELADPSSPISSDDEGISKRCTAALRQVKPRFYVLFAQANRGIVTVKSVTSIQRGLILDQRPTRILSLSDKRVLIAGTNGLLGIACSTFVDTVDSYQDLPHHNNLHHFPPSSLPSSLPFPNATATESCSYFNSNSAFFPLVIDPVTANCSSNTCTPSNSHAFDANITAISYNRDSGVIASGDSKGILCLWRLSDVLKFQSNPGQLQLQLQQHQQQHSHPSPLFPPLAIFAKAGGAVGKSHNMNIHENNYDDTTMGGEGEGCKESESTNGFEDMERGLRRIHKVVMSPSGRHCIVALYDRLLLVGISNSPTQQHDKPSLFVRAFLDVIPDKRSQYDVSFQGNKLFIWRITSIPQPLDTCQDPHKGFVVTRWIHKSVDTFEHRCRISATTSKTRKETSSVASNKTPCSPSSPPPSSITTSPLSSRNRHTTSLYPSHTQSHSHSHAHSPSSHTEEGLSGMLPLHFFSTQSHSHAVSNDFMHNSESSTNNMVSSHNVADTRFASSSLLPHGNFSVRSTTALTTLETDDGTWEMEEEEEDEVDEEGALGGGGGDLSQEEIREVKSEDEEHEMNESYLSLLCNLCGHDGSPRWLQARPFLAAICAAATFQPPTMALIAAAFELDNDAMLERLQHNDVFSHLLQLSHESVGGSPIITASSSHPSILKWLCSPCRIGEEWWIDMSQGHNHLCLLYLRYCSNKSVAVEHSCQEYLRTYGCSHLRNCSRDLRTLTGSIRKIDETAGIKGTIPRQVGWISGLQELYARRVGLYGKIPNEIGELTSLRVLSMGNNQLTGPLPDTLSRLKSLQRIVLHQNRLFGVVPPS